MTVKKQFLTQGWKCCDFAPGRGIPVELSQLGLDTAGWLDIKVPGDVNDALIQAGRMPNPHIADHARQCYWVTSREWWYRLEFASPSGGEELHTDLCLDGVDGHVTLYLNGDKIGCMENAFRPYRIAVTDQLRHERPNVVLLRFQAIDEILGGPRQDESGKWGLNRVLMRKPQFSFGWDWSLQLPSIGMAGSVHLEQHTQARLVNVSVQPYISGRLDFKFQVTKSARTAGYGLLIRIKGHGTEIEKKIEPSDRVFSHTSVFIKNPKLWWPHGMGSPTLYNYEVDLVVAGLVTDRYSGRLGIREVMILEEPFTPEAGPGITFWIMVNGQKVFCKGGNWIPLEIWPALATEEQYRFYLQKTAAANFNMQRVWGGGIYERDIFYDLCDELGIMVWQDFMFASGEYPADRLRHEIIAEADYQIRRLRNRPSIVLWCGCNEDVFSWSLPNEKAMATADTGVYNQNDAAPAVKRLRDDPQIYSMILRGLVSKLGLNVPYVESSPQSYEDAGNMPESGNCHISCWKYALFETQQSGNTSDKALAAGKSVSLQDSDGQPELFRHHFEKVCSFNSEFCIQGPSDVRTMKQFLTAPHEWPPDDIWTYHIQRGHALLPHYEQTLFIAQAVFGPINNLQTYVKYGQALHAEMMRAEFESARRDRPNNGGTLLWMFNDCWPTANWSIIDYYRRPKPAYYAAKHVCAPCLPIIFERAGKIEFFFSNDTPESCAVCLNFGQETLNGKRIWTQQTDLKSEKYATAKFFSIQRSDLKVGSGNYLFIDAQMEGAILPRVTYFPDLWKNITWPTPRIKLEIVKQAQHVKDWVTEVKISTDTYGRFCHLVLPESTAPFWLDDNFFDMCPNTSRTVSCCSAKRLDLKDIMPGHWLTDWP